MTTAPDALQRLHHALDRLAGALASGDPARVLAAEEPLAEAVRGLDAGVSVTGVASSDLARAVGELRVLVGRCRALGALSNDLLTTISPAVAYGPAGGLAPAMRAAHGGSWR